MPPESSSSPLVLLTGSTGFIGLRVLYHLLKQSYRVRCAVRSLSRAQSTIPHVPIISQLAPSPQHLSYIEIGDFASPDAWTEAIEGVTYVIHIASPLPGSNPQGHLDAQESFIRPAVRGSLGVLEAASLSPTVRRVVITSSVVALIPAAVWLGQTPPSPGEVYTAQTRQPTEERNEFPTPGHAYCASKVASLNAAEEWVKDHEGKVRFDVVHIHPGWVMGYADIYANGSVEGFMGSTNRFGVWTATGRESWIKGGLAVDVDDCAVMHVNALSEERLPSMAGKGGCRSFLAAREWRWASVNEVVRESFPEEVERGVFMAEEKEGTAVLEIDDGGVEGVLGVKFRDVKESVRELLKQYLELSKRGEGVMNGAA